MANSFNVKINGDDFKIFEFDDEESVIDRYALEIGEDALPEYFAFQEPPVFEENTKFIIDDVRDVIKKMSEQDLQDEELVAQILGKYPIKKGTIGILWIKDKIKNLDKLNLEGPIKKLSQRGIFSTKTRTKLTLEDYERDLKKRRKLMIANASMMMKMFEKLGEQDKIDATSFILEDILLNIKFASNQNIIEIFDNINASLEIPFIEVHNKSKTYYKVHTSIIPLETWFESTSIKRDNYIRFMLLNGHVNPLSVKNIEKHYTEGVIFINLDGDYEIEFPFVVTPKFKEEDVVARVFDMFGDRLDHKILYRGQTAIRGVFRVRDFEYNSILFSDFLCTNPLASRMFFLDERLKSVLDKNKFYFYYDPKELRIPTESLGISLKRDDAQKSTQIRITRAKNVEKAENLRLVLLRILALYETVNEEIAKSYLDLFSKEKIGSYQKKTVEKEQKTKQRLQRLAEENPFIFRKQGYSNQCQKPFQPYIVPKEDVKKLAKQIGHSDDNHKMINYEGVWYACEPRDDSDPKSADLNIWPGLKPNTKGDEQYKKEVPYLPCCFKANQYKKKGSAWRKYYDGLEETKEPQVKSGVGYIVGIRKMCNPGRKGELPFLWEKILRVLGIKKVQLGSYAKTDKPIYPLLRIGVLHSPDSIIHCLELATNSTYPTTPERQADRVLEVRKELASLDNYSVAKQSLYTETRKMIRNNLKDQNAYIDPRQFIEILQERYKCNIFLYEYSDNNPDGEIVLPAFSQAYLQKQVSSDRPTVLILMYEAKNKPYPYQCEIICKISVKEGKEDKTKTKYSFLSESNISKTAIKLFYDHNEVFTVNPNGYELYTPINE